MSQHRVQSGVREGGQFAATKHADADPSVALAEQSKRELPAELAAGIPSAARISDISDAAYEHYRTAESAISKVDELRLARAAVDLYAEHGITSVGVSAHEDVEGSFVSVDQVELDTGESLDEGDAFEAAEEAVMNIGMNTEGFRDGESTSIDLIDLIRRAPELEREVEAATRKPMNVTETIELADTLRLIDRQSRIRWTDDGGDTIRSGVVHTGIWNADGQPVRDADAREAHLRITTSTGTEIFKPATELTRLRREGALAEDS